RRKVAEKQSLVLRDPLDVARIGKRRTPVISPARRFSDDRLVNLVAPFSPPRLRRFGRQRSAVEKVLVHAVGERETEFGAAPEVCVERAGRIRRAYAYAVRIRRVERVLAVPVEETKACSGLALSTGVPVLVGPVEV